jgi:NADH:ubiquinone oxidoreductase subunit D
MPRNPEEREKPIHSTEVSPGTRPHAASSLAGRLRYDIPLRRIDSSVHRSMHSARKLKEIHNISPMNRSRRTRSYEIGPIEREFRSPSGSTGSSSRPAKTIIDARFSGHEFYHCFDYPISIAPNGDRPDRYPSRSNEIIEPRRIIHAIPYVMFQLNR